MESAPPIAFKEWQVVCDALASGRQSILLRKGGIHEGKDGFSFAHDRFVLFPTRFHASPSQVREGDVMPAPEWREGDVVQITNYVRVMRAVTFFEWQHAAALEPLHIYSEDTVRERFYWQGRNMPSGSIHVALVQVCTLSKPWEIPYSTRFGGCRSWITLPEAPPDQLKEAAPVIPLSQLANIEEKFFS